jgi:crotonobetainyl-CoA:carnitine CoA-transferase CaiB-like acyl-CoA transferase
VHPGYPIGDPIAGVFGAFGILAALLHRAQHPEAPGQEIDLACTEAMMRILEVLPIEWDQLGQVHEPVGNGNAYVSPSGMFRAGDGGWVSFTAATQNVFERLCRLIGREDLLADPRFADPWQRFGNRVALTAELERTFLGRSLEEWRPILDGAGLIWAPVLRLDEAILDPQAREIGCFDDLEHPTAGRFQTVSTPFRIDGEPIGARRPASPLGADAREVLREAGLDEGEIEKLV